MGGSAGRDSLHLETRISQALNFDWHSGWKNDLRLRGGTDTLLLCSRASCGPWDPPLPFGDYPLERVFRSRSLDPCYFAKLPSTMSHLQKTTVAKPDSVPQKWFLVDAEDQVLGRLASDIATILMGKHRPTYSPHVDTGDFVVVLNAEKVMMTGQKFRDRHYAWYTGYTGQKLESYGDRRERRPEDLILHAVRRMLPKNKLARKMLSKLKIYVGTEHPHQAQACEPLEIGKKLAS